MHDNDRAERAVAASRQEWFSMLVSYMKMRTLAVWLHYYPETRYESFDMIWPALFDRMLSEATRSTITILARQNSSREN
jgi:hypothetical protein